MCRGTSKAITGNSPSGFCQVLTGAYTLTIEDADGLAKSYDFDLNVQQDPLPVVNLLRPSTSQSVLANAEITLQVEASDEVFGLRSVYLEYRRKDKHGRWVDAEPKKPSSMTTTGPTPSCRCFSPPWDAHPRPATRA